MKSVYCFVVKPKGERYNNSVQVGDKSLIVNTENFNHQYVNREAEVVSCPIVGDDLGIKPGDTVLVHHNVFRRWLDIKGKEKNSRSYFNENTYIIYADQIFLRKQQGKWACPNGFCFVQPIKATSKYNTDQEKPLMGIVKYTDGTVSKGDLVGFRPNSEYEFVFEGKRLYRVLSNFITIKYEYQGDEEEYNPSWS
tara:strand:+ start:1684 stop:2268 length:585 start_codon:yes stop_codon:yes gene_type:complete